MLVVTKKDQRGKILAEIMINEERLRQKKRSQRRNFSRKIDQQEKNLAEKVINEEFQNKIV